jgi:uncharacterized damage-inducible protein DinB
LLTESVVEQLRYPIGRFDPRASVSADRRPALIDQIEEAPAKLRAAVAGLNDQQLDTPYRDGGWTVRQVVHHVPDSHLNAYIRLKLALTEDQPLIKTYEEHLWAQLPDARVTPIEVSLTLLESVHVRFVILLRAMSDAEFNRTFRHPDWGTMSLSALVSLYAWHGRHHVAHITSLRQRMGW